MATKELGKKLSTYDSATVSKQYRVSSLFRTYCQTWVLNKVDTFMWVLNKVDALLALVVF
eukprot:4311597-Amphidinium_carterae.1